MSYLAVGIAGAGALGKGLTSIFQGRSARKIERMNQFPIEQLNPIYQQNAAQAENAARVGLPQQQYNNSLNNILRNQSGALSMFARNPQRTNLSALLRASNDATMNLDTQDAISRVANQRFALGQKLNLAQEQTRLFDVNKRQRYLQLLAKSEALRGAQAQNGMGAFNDLSRVGLLAAGGGLGSISGGGQMGRGGLTRMIFGSSPDISNEGIGSVGAGITGDGLVGKLPF